jgi:hypothetical protein
VPTKNLLQIEVDALLRGVSDAPIDSDFSDYDEEGRSLVQYTRRCWRGLGVLGMR